MLLAIVFHFILKCSLENLTQNRALVVRNSSGRCIASAVISFCSLLPLHLVSRHLANVPERNVI